MVDAARWATQPYDGYVINRSLEEDAELTHVGPGTPCGEYLRRFWHPVAMSTQLADLPVAIRILGEDLVIFRDKGGRIGLLHKHCAHRRASLEFGRIEERGIRCCYHGWHFDVDGTILETPGEADSSPIRRKVCQGAYPVREVKGLIFAYLGPRDDLPGFPYLDALDLPGHELVPYSIQSPCNWLQETENAMDPFHSVFLHGRVNGPQFPGLEHFVELPVVTYDERPEGFVYSHARRMRDLVVIRYHDYFMPNIAQNGAMFQKMDSPKTFGRMSLTKWVVPIDDTHSRKFGWRHFNDNDEVLRQGNKTAVGWESIDFYGQTGHRTYEEMQRNPGDWDAWTGQGSISIHQRECLGVTDKGVSMLRRRLRSDIRNIAQGQSVHRPSGTPDRPIHTYGGDTIVRVPRDGGHDTVLLAKIQREVTKIYFEADRLIGEERTEYIRREVAARFPS